MTKKIIFQDTFLVSGIMCFQGCGAMIQTILNSTLEDCKQDNLLPADAQLIIDAEPNGLGIHRLIVTIESEQQDFIAMKGFHEVIATKLKENIGDLGFEIIDNQEDSEEESNKTNWINIIINLLAMGAIISLSLAFPPSILLTVGLTAISFLTTAFTAREYLINFYRNLRNKNLANMTTTITLGWLLSLAHTLFHAITMPLAGSFSMIFMSFIMPILSITFINGMNEIKRQVLHNSKKMQLKGMKTIFPQMAEEYDCYPLEQQELTNLQQLIDDVLNPENSEKPSPNNLLSIQALLRNKTRVKERKNLLQEGMVIQIKRGECFPVDCILIEGNTIIDASLLTGEPQQVKDPGDKIPAGAINLGQAVTVYATNNSYTSTVNRLLFPANRARTSPTSEATPKFIYLYTALLIAGIVAAIVAPVAFGVFTVPLLLQNLTGILFSTCLCTVAIAHQLPNLISVFHRNKKGIQVRDEHLTGRTDAIHTIVFDKTGTLTTGNSLVESSDISSTSLWERIYLLEKENGAEHPLAKAIMNYYETKMSPNIILNTIKNCTVDFKNRGLSALVQGKKIHIGNAAYLQESGIELPEINRGKIEQGLTPVFVAEDNHYQGVIYIKHELRPGILPALSRLKREGKKIIMLTGDSKLAALGFNQQNSAIFEKADIHAEQTPQDKEEFLTALMSSQGTDPKGVWFIGDGLNDAPCARIVSEKGGLSCAMNANDKAAFFTDICLNGSLDYLFKHHRLNQFLQKNVLQNQGILAFSTIAFLAFIISFSVVGIAVSPLIPLAIMLSTTLFILFNSYRVQLSIDIALDKNSSWPKQLLASDLSIGLLLGAGSLLICGILIATIASGGLVLPAIIFSAGAAAALSSCCTLTAIILFSLFALLATSYVAVNNCTNLQLDEKIELSTPAPIRQEVCTSAFSEEKASYSQFYRKPRQTTSTADVTAQGPVVENFVV